MKRYDELHELKVIESKVGLKNFTVPLKQANKELLEEFISSKKHTVYVRCRKCNCIHDYNAICRCGLTSKLNWNLYD